MLFADGVVTGFNVDDVIVGFIVLLILAIVGIVEAVDAFSSL